ncbi:MAG: nitrile hydratase subunit beta [Rhodospirillaceae bacterium]|jgi:nitrile hydratase|nr:nitrile hydratase subunit beta [Rhodospirillaceae bacterium]MBT3490864.1 nitrile hydratase subunit beta [Rhodospirillaceae bacterium]MBT3778691.1 nitrile hydratase subunit beta [Rhodospirillaceae bacterium]MBT3976642.1 nitrile hydratase subunit beta [Rhodospirillaceae bacterium]MBT4169442.1 nitrile hydratase subunit beta [Rhodospirillaceae bacterium]
MDGIHDMGGMDGFGPIPIEQDEPVFHAPWEGRMWALNAALGALGHWNIDAGRYALEQMNPALYLNSSYYLRWLYRTEDILVAHEMVSREEIETPPGQRQVEKQAEPLSHAEIVARARAAKSARSDVDVTAGFKAGDLVRARNIHPTGHTRLPRYVRGRTGLIEKDYGVFVFPDTRAVFAGDKPQHLYSVSFTAQELWGEEAAAKDKVYLDIWDDYLELGG